MRLLRRKKLPLLRSTGNWDENGDWVSTATDAPDTFYCSVQPFKNSNKQFTLPEGIKSTDARVVYTQTELRTANQFTKQEADRTTIDGFTFYAESLKDWNVGNPRTDHYEVVFIREGLETGY